jgi:uncharacterized membrane protein (DUF106 family)
MGIGKLASVGLIVLIMGITLIYYSDSLGKVPPYYHSDTIVILFLGGGVFLILGIAIILAVFLELANKVKMDEERMREMNAITRIKNVFNEAGYSQSDIEELTKLAVVMLKEGTNDDDWTSIGPTKLMTTVQAAVALLGKKP